MVQRLRAQWASHAPSMHREEQSLRTALACFSSGWSVDPFNLGSVDVEPKQGSVLRLIKANLRGQRNLVQTVRSFQSCSSGVMRPRPSTSTIYRKSKGRVRVRRKTIFILC